MALGLSGGRSIAVVLAVSLSAAHGADVVDGTTGIADSAEAPQTSAVGATSGGDAASGEHKAAFIYVGPVGDAGWTYRHDQARQCLEERTGVETAFVESVPETADVATVERDFIDQGFDMIFATAFGYQPFTQEVANENPDVKFFGITPTVAPADNISNFYGELWDGRFLTGMVAGSLTETDVIGFVAANPIPTVIAGINAFTLGVRSVNPDATVRVIWTLSWFDPPAEFDNAIALIDSGADVIAQHQDTPSTVEAAQERGVWAIGSESDMSQFGPDVYLTGTVWDWCSIYENYYEVVVNDSFEAGEVYGGLADGTVALAPFGAGVPADVQSEVEQVRQQLIDGEFDYWAGPLLTNEGEQVVPEGGTLTIEDINGTDWLVEGVDGSIPG